ncbi:MAG: hypothetical protein ACE5GA_07145 [Candidatus Zixiibacteriota bacterium]
MSSMEIKGPTAPLTLRQQAPIPVERAKLPPDKLELEKLRLRKATREFESLFLASILK